MHIRQRWLLGLVYLLCLLSASIGQMQDQSAVVPNLVGLNIAQATAALNHVGLALGKQTSAASGEAQNAISAQSVPAGQALALGSSVDVTIVAATDAAENTTPYIYLAYTPDRLVIHNRSQAQFMPLTDSHIMNNNPNLTPPHQRITLGDTSLYTLLNPVATVTQLAPNQCILFTNSADIQSLDTPEPCDVIARLDIGQNLIFWADSFDVESVTDGQSYTCDAATAGQLTVCIMPR
jgi:hypothetical protein